MIFSNREHEVDDYFLSNGQNSIQRLEDFKFLGVLIDDKLSFRTHVNKYCRRYLNPQDFSTKYKIACPQKHVCPITIPLVTHIWVTT